MKFVRYSSGGAAHYGVLDGESLERLTAAPFLGGERTGERQDAGKVQWLCPIENPRIFAVGMNYVGHIAEAGAKTPEMPQMFMMPSTAAVGTGQEIVLPPEATMVHHECELAVVIGKSGRRIAAENARDYILGYTCANDVSERVIQNKEMALGTLLIGKSFDTFCPLGPVIDTEVDPSRLDISTRVNGVVRQQGNTADMLFSPETIVSYLSQAITLLPGDVILTGTPSGVGPLLAGDVCEVTIQGIGTLSNPVRAE